MFQPELSVVTDLLREGLATGQTPYLAVSSGSMSPLLRVGDQVGLQQAAVEQLRAGDVVVVWHDTSLLTHRFYGVRTVDTEQYLVTRGDRVPHFDPLWSASKLLGRAVVRRRGEKLLWLDLGRGQWLNRRLSELAQLEYRMLGVTGAAPQRDGRRLTSRILRAAFRLCAGGLTRTIEKL